MPPEPAFSFAVVCEGPEDYRTACDLADRVLKDKVAWLADTADYVDQLRQWRGLWPSEQFLAWKKVPALARGEGIRTHGRFAGEDGHVARQALLLLKKQPARPHAVLLIRDTDEGCPLAQAPRSIGIREACQEERWGRWPFPIVVGIEHPKRECWVLAGFLPRTEEERERHRQVRERLGFDPCLYAERLSASQGQKKPDAKRDPKLVLEELVAGDRHREAVCWLETDLAALTERGQGTGLAAYLDELRRHLVPLFGAQPLFAAG